VAQALTRHLTHFDPHGYFFASLPDNVNRRRLQRFGEPLTDELIPVPVPMPGANLQSGVLTCRLVCITPVHIGNGGYRHDPDVPGNVVADLVRDLCGNPIIPGASLKGSFRALAEAISKSCLLLRQSQYQEKQNELPRQTVGQLQQLAQERAIHVPGNVEVQVETDKFAQCNVPSDEKERQQKGVRLCPCCAVFGALLYRGRISFSDASIVDQHRPYGDAPIPLFVRIPARYGGRVHRLAPPRELHPVKKDQKVLLEIKHPLGRRLYPNWDPCGFYLTDKFDWTVFDRRLPDKAVLNQGFFQNFISRAKANQGQWQQRNFSEPHAVFPIGSVLRFCLHFSALREWELGMLLTAMGLSAQYWWLPKVGGAKAYGLGTVLIIPEELRLEQDTWRSFAGQPQVTSEPSLRPYLQGCINAFEGSPAFHRNGALDLQTGFSPDLQREVSEGRVEVLSS
jgi:hypothetical protein